ISWCSSFGDLRQSRCHPVSHHPAEPSAGAQRARVVRFSGTASTLHISSCSGAWLISIIRRMKVAVRRAFVPVVVERELVEDRTIPKPRLSTRSVAARLPSCTRLTNAEQGGGLNADRVGVLRRSGVD